MQTRNEINQTVPTNKTITVKGEGRASVKPDTVLVEINGETTDLLYEKTMEKAEIQLQQLRESIAKAGLPREDLKTSDFSVSRQYKNEKEENGNYKSVFSGYQCRHSLTVEFALDMKKLGGVLSALSACPQNPEFQIRFTVKDKDAAIAAMLENAAKNAKYSAEILCKASGVRLGNLLNIDYHRGDATLFSPTNYAVGLCRSAAPLAAKSIDIEPQNIDLNDSVAFTWEID